jgi:hypothetical protein
VAQAKLIDRRLRALEATCGIGGGGGRCPDCGGLLDGEPDPEATYELLFEDEWEEAGLGDIQENVYCQTCGGLIYGVLSF